MLFKLYRFFSQFIAFFVKFVMKKGISVCHRNSTLGIYSHKASLDQYLRKLLVVHLTLPDDICS